MRLRTGLFVFLGLLAASALVLWRVTTPPPPPVAAVQLAPPPVAAPPAPPVEAPQPVPAAPAALNWVKVLAARASWAILSPFMPPETSGPPRIEAVT